MWRVRSKSLRMGVAAFALLSVLPTLTQAQSSTFYYPDTETQFSVTIANGTDVNQQGDVFLYITSPAYSWVGFGFGQGMRDSLMFIVYPSKDGKNVTVSPRIGAHHTEPTYTKEIDQNLELLPGTAITDNMFVIRAVCHFCRVWPGGAIDVSRTTYPMSFAFGPGTNMQSNSKSAPLERHSNFGTFTMDMRAATGKGEVPLPTKEVNGVTMGDGGIKRDHHRADLAHAVLGCLAVFVIWPLNVVVGGFFKRIGVHVGVSVLLLAFLVASYGLGFGISHQFNRSKTYTSPHQLLAFLALIPLLAISVLPIPSLTKTLTKHFPATPSFIPRLHTPLTTLTLLLLLLTGGLGLHLASTPRTLILVYTALSLLVFVFSSSLYLCIGRRGSAYARARRGLREEKEEDEQDLVLKEMAMQSRSSSATGGQMYGAEHAGSGSAGRANIYGVYGGGAMPGPRYMMNMHPGVPVQVGRL